MKEYKLVVTSNDFIKHYVIKAQNLSSASKKARIQFAKDFNKIGKEVTVKLEPLDLSNHIDEIINTLYT